MYKRIPHLVALATLGLGISGCDDPTGPPGVALLLQVRVVSAPTVFQSASASRSPATAPGLESIDISEVALAVGGLTLHKADINGMADFVLEAPVVVPLRLSGDPTLALSTPVPPDEYKSIEVFVDKLDPGVPADDDLITVFPALEGASVLVRGTTVRDGADQLFTFTAPVSLAETYTFPQPRRFSSTFRSVALYTLEVELDGWFRTELGELLDPGDPADRAAIEANIAASMEVFQGSPPPR